MAQGRRTPIPRQTHLGYYVPMIVNMASCGPKLALEWSGHHTWKFPVLRRHPKLICRPIPLCVLTKSHFNPSRNSTSTVYRNLLHLNLYWKVNSVRPPALEVPKIAPGERLQNVAKLLPRLVHTSTWKSETQSSLLVTTTMPGPLQHTSESNLLWMSMSRGTEQYPQWRRPANRGHRNNSFNNFEVEWTRSQWSMGHDSTKASPAANSTPVTWGTEFVKASMEQVVTGTWTLPRHRTSRCHPHMLYSARWNQHTPKRSLWGLNSTLQL